MIQRKTFVVHADRQLLIYTRGLKYLDVDNLYIGIYITSCDSTTHLSRLKLYWYFVELEL